MGKFSQSRSILSGKNGKKRTLFYGVSSRVLSIAGLISDSFHAPVNRFLLRLPLCPPHSRQKESFPRIV